MPGAKTWVHSAPEGIPLKYKYAPSKDGVDRNLLVLLHGMGDSAEASAKLGATLNLPQTAVLALEGPAKVPFFDDAFSWWTLTPEMFMAPPMDTPEALQPVMPLLLETLDRLHACGWADRDIHLFGFAQGGSAALQLAIEHSSRSQGSAFGSIVDIHGPLLVEGEAPQGSSAAPLYAVMKESDRAVAAKRFPRIDGHAAALRNDGDRLHLPKGEAEWRPVMAFWAEHLVRVPAHADYEVV